MVLDWKARTTYMRDRTPPENAMLRKRVNLIAPRTIQLQGTYRFE